MLWKFVRSLSSSAARKNSGIPRIGRRAVRCQLETLESRRVLASWTQQQELLPGGIAANDDVGRAVAIEGDLAVVGSRLEDLSGTNTNEGAVFVFRRSGSTWSQIAMLVASDGALNDRFGHAVAISNGTIVVSAIGDDVTFGDEGSAYVFEQTGPTTWTQTAHLLPVPDFVGQNTVGENFGESVAIDGNTIAIGARSDNDAAGVVRGSVYSFQDTGSGWTALPPQKIRASDGLSGDRFGFDVAIHVNRIVAGAPFDDTAASNDGSVYVFDRPSNASPFAEVAKIVAGGDASLDDEFGTSVAVEGSTILVGAQKEGGNGAAYVFTGGGAVWSQQAKLLPTSGSLFGVSVDLQGDLAVVGATGGVNGRAFAFARAGTTWGSADLIVPNDSVVGDADVFGQSVGIDAGFIIVGAPLHDHTGAASNSGGAYVFVDPNDPPVNAVPGPQTTDEDVPLEFSAANLNAISVSDPDAFAADIEVTLEATNGTVTLGDAGLVTLLVGDGDGDALVTFRGTIAEINAALDGTQFLPAADYFGAASLKITTDDLGNTGTGGAMTDEDTIAITVDPVNDAPTANAQNVDVDEDGQVPINLSGTDVETPTGNLTFTILSLPATGLLTVGGVAVQINDTFSGPPALVYEPSVGSGATSASFDFTVTDDGDDSAPGQDDETSAAATVTIGISPAVADGTATLVDGVLRAGGGSGNDSVIVSRSGSTWNVSINGTTTTFALATVNEIRIWGRDGNDSIIVDTNISIPATIDAGAGNDVVTGGNGNDLIFGGDGVDLLFGNGGNDMVIGGEGFDFVSGGAGHDVVVAGSVAANFTAAMLRDVAAAWAAERTATEGIDDGTIDESAFDGNFDILSGGSGADWFIVNLGDWIIDYRPNGVNGDLITQI